MGFRCYHWHWKDSKLGVWLQERKSKLRPYFPSSPCRVGSLRQLGAGVTTPDRMEISHKEALNREVGLHSFPFWMRWLPETGIHSPEPYLTAWHALLSKHLTYRVLLVFSKMLWWLGCLRENQKLYFWGFSQHSTTQIYIIISQERKTVHH